MQNNQIDNDDCNINDDDEFLAPKLQNLKNTTQDLTEYDQ